MATTQTDITPTQRIFPFTGIPDVSSVRSDLPRAEIRGFVADQDIAQAGLGNDRVVVFTQVMPANFSYALVSCSFVFFAGTGETTDFTSAYSYVQIGTVAGNRRYIPLETKVSSSEATQTIRAFYQFSLVPPKEVLMPDPGQDVRLIVSVPDPVDNGPANICNFHSRFLQFDVSQAHHVQVNTPTLIR